MNNIISTSDKHFGFDCLLFESCNLRCKFCLEDHSNNKIDLNWIHNIPDLIIKRFKIEYPKFSTTEIVSIRIWGGELFYDSLPDSLFDEYLTLVNNIKDKFKSNFPNIKCIFSWVTNGVFTKRKRLVKLLKETNSTLNMSYDPVGRYQTKTQERTMFYNAKLFSRLKLLDELSITLTKPNIEAYINNKSNLLNFIFIKKFDINYYIPNINYETLLPNDDDLFNFFKWVIDNKISNVLDVKHIINSFYFPTHEKESVCNCDRHLSVCKNCITFNCVKSSTVFPDKDFYGEDYQKITEDNVAIIKKQKGILKRGCLFCKYNNICPQQCWTSILYKNFKITQCPIKRIYEYLKENCPANIYKSFE